MNYGLAKKLGSLFVSRIGTVPAAVAAATRNGTGIDRATPGGALYTGCTLVGSLGATSGTPTSFTATFKLQDSADNSTYADFVPGGEVAAAGALTENTTASTLAEKDINLSAARRYIRVVEVVAFVGGTSPTIGVCSQVILYGSDRTPV